MTFGRLWTNGVDNSGQQQLLQQQAEEESPLLVFNSRTDDTHYGYGAAPERGHLDPNQPQRRQDIGRSTSYQSDNHRCSSSNNNNLDNYHDDDDDESSTAESKNGFMLLPVFENEKKLRRRTRRRQLQRLQLVSIGMLAVVTTLFVASLSTSKSTRTSKNLTATSTTTGVSPLLQRLSFSDIPLLGQLLKSKSRPKKIVISFFYDDDDENHSVDGDENHDDGDVDDDHDKNGGTKKKKKKKTTTVSPSSYQQSSKERQKESNKRQQKNQKDVHNNDHDTGRGSSISSSDGRKRGDDGNNNYHDESDDRQKRNDHGSGDHDGDNRDDGKENRKVYNDSRSGSSSSNSGSSKSYGDNDDIDDIQCASSDWKCWRNKYAKKYSVDAVTNDDSTATITTTSPDSQYYMPNNGTSKGDDGNDGNSNTSYKQNAADSSKSEGSSYDNKTSTSSDSLWTKPMCGPDDWKCWVNIYKDQAMDGATNRSEKGEDASLKQQEDSPDKDPNDYAAESSDDSYRKGKDDSKSKDSSKEDDGGDGDDDDHDHDDQKKSTKKKKSDSCSDGSYAENTLKLAYELPFAALFKDLKGRKKFEASSVTTVDDVAYAIDDASWSISVFDPFLEPFGEYNRLLSDPDRHDADDSGFEAIFADNNTFYVVRESVRDENNTYHAVIEELSLGFDIDSEDYDYSLDHSCQTEFQFDGDSKGFEGAIPVHDQDDNLIVLGLCEGNYCSQSKELHREKGNGRLVAMKETELDGKCLWNTVRIINIPPSAYFGDYSSIAMADGGRVAISSQEESQLWIGYLDGHIGNNRWDIDAMRFVADNFTLYNFPKNDECQTVYCNIEGITFLDQNTILAVSDKMKGNGKQSFQCRQKDQSSHVFMIP